MKGIQSHIAATDGVGASISLAGSAYINRAALHCTIKYQWSDAR